MLIGQGVSAQLPSMVGWMEELLLGGQQVGRVVQTVQRVKEVHLQGRIHRQRERNRNKDNSFDLTASKRLLVYCECSFCVY